MAGQPGSELTLDPVFRASARAMAPVMLSGTLAAHVAAAFVVTQLDAIVSWPALRAELLAAPPGVAGALAIAVAAAWGAAIAGAVRSALERVQFLAPLPLAPPWRAAAVLPAVLLATGWPAAAGWLLGTPWIVVTPLWTGLFAVLLATRRPGALALAGAALLGPAVGLLAFLLAIPCVGRALDRPLPRSRPWRIPVRPVGPVSALVWRDLLALGRRFPLALGASVAWAAPAWAVEGGLAASPAGSDPFLLATLGVAALIAVAGLGRVTLMLGSQVTPPSWPITARQRATAFALAGAVLLAPTLAVLPVRTAVSAPAYAAGIALALGRRDGLAGFLWVVIAVCVAGSLPGAPLSLGILAIGLFAWAVRRC